LQLKPHAGGLPAQYSVAFGGGLGHAVPEMPQLSTLPLVTQVFPERCVPAGQLKPHWALMQTAVAFDPDGTVQALLALPHAVAESTSQALPSALL
jgi:hypothetical protein